jgi:hypothetical protein
MTTIKDQWVRLIEHTDDGIAPMVVQEAYTAINRLGKLMAGVSNPAIVEGYQTKLLTAWDGTPEADCYKAEFVMALAAMLGRSLKGWKNSVCNETQAELPKPPLWLRTCRKCGACHTSFLQPRGAPTEAYLHAECLQCHSTALDYGHRYNPPITDET